MICSACKAQNDAEAEACFTCGMALYALTQGTVLAGRYEILSPLGRGGMGRVYKAQDRVLGELVAIKVLRSEFAREPGMARRFLHEIKLARKVSHRNVCRIHEYGEDGGLRYICMEFVDGINLKEFLRAHPLPPDHAFELSLQLAEGLEAVHEHGVIHRDFKASNVMVDSRGVARLMDFGIAKQAGDDVTSSSAPGSVIGTPEYMSPEQARGALVDFRSDIYSLGCVVFEVFTGEAPFRGETTVATLYKHLNDPPPLEGLAAAGLPPPLVPVLRRALAKVPADRYATVAEFAAALREARAAAGLSAPAARSVVPPEATAERTRIAASQGSRPITPVLTRPATPPAAEGARTSPPETRTIWLPGGEMAPQRSRPRRVWAWAAPLLLVFAGAALLWQGISRPDAATPAASPADGPPVTVAAAPSPEAPETPPASALPAPSATDFTPPPAAPPSPRTARDTGTDPSARAATAVLPTASPSPGPARAARAAAPSTPAPTGILRLLVVPEAEVTVDGAAIGRVSLKDIPLPAGDHTVVVSHPEYDPLSRKVTVRPGLVERLVLDLSVRGVRRRP